MKQTTLKKLRNVLEMHENDEYQTYYVPKAWTFISHKKTKEKIVEVNPYRYYKEQIDHILNHPAPLLNDYRDAYYYSTMIRTSTTFDHNQNQSIEVTNTDGFKETGTFVKMIAYLPTLKAMGINVIYLLPIMQYSRMDKKGELGSVYGVSDFFSIDEELFDPITKDEMTLDEQFSAFVEACHTLGMRVVLDIIPRTNSVNTTLLMSHPDWFYWIKLDDLKNYKPPKVDGIPPTTAIEEKYLQQLYASKETKEHLAKFQEAPNIRDPKKWNELVARYQVDPSLNPLELIRKTFDMTVAPAFSDQINDVQPAWTDVTFFRLYMDQPKLVRDKKLTDTIVPYILFDTIKANLFPGEIPNESLWDTLSNILPYYIENFDLDGARTDMGHALPEALTRKIITKAKAYKPDFYFIAEELTTTKSSAKQAKALGYDLIIGDGFYHTHRFHEQLTRDFYYNGMCLPTMVFAAGETHDTPRLISRKGGYQTTLLITILNQFAYNFAPFMNSGQELLEKQAMNTGVDVDKDTLYALDINDAYYMKLALFDKYEFHYDSAYESFMETLFQIANIKAKYKNLLRNKENVAYIATPDKDQVIFHYQDANQHLYILANANLYESKTFDLQIQEYDVLYSTTTSTSLTLEPLALRIIWEEN